MVSSAASTYQRTQQPYAQECSCSTDSMQSVGQIANLYCATQIIEGLALAMLMTKVSLEAEQLSIYGTKQEIEAIDQKSAAIRESRMKSAEKANKTEKACKRWSVMTKVFSWLTTATTIVAGIALIATGAGVAAGALLLISGLLAMTNHLLEITGTWNKIAAKLDTETGKSRSIIMWLQVAILAVSVVLAGAGAIFGGLSVMQEALKTAGTVFSGVANAGVGTLMVSIAILNRDYFNRLAEIKRYEKHLEELRQDRKDHVEYFEGHVQECDNIHSLLTRMLKMHNQTSKLILHHIKR